MKILLFGADGQLGKELQRSLSVHGTVVCLNREQADLSDQRRISEVISDHAPGLVVNAAAYTAVDAAESQLDVATVVNRNAVATMAEQAKRIGAFMIHYSTDYVFSGEASHPYTPEDEPDPRSVYGLTKLQGEQALLRTGCHAVILRTSWVYSVNGKNFAKTMLRLAQERSELQVVSDQVGAPTSAELIADVTSLLIHRIFDRTVPSGIYHLTASGETSWHGFARFLIAQASYLGVPLAVDESKIRAISTQEFPTEATRPPSSKMSNEKLESLLNIKMPDWTVHARRVVEQLTRERC